MEAALLVGYGWRVGGGAVLQALGRCWPLTTVRRMKWFRDSSDSSSASVGWRRSLMIWAKAGWAPRRAVRRMISRQRRRSNSFSKKRRSRDGGRGGVGVGGRGN